MKNSDQTKTVPMKTKLKLQYFQLTGLGAATTLATTLIYVALTRTPKLPWYLGE